MIRLLTFITKTAESFCAKHLFLNVFFIENKCYILFPMSVPTKTQNKKIIVFVCLSVLNKRDTYRTTEILPLL